MIFNQNLPAIVSSLRQEDLRVLCDGSFDVGYGTSAWFPDGDGYLVRGVDIVPIGSDILDATRCELARIYTILRITQCMIQYFNLDEAAIEIGSDCENGLNRTLLSTDKTPLYYINGSHFDLINC